MNSTVWNEFAVQLSENFSVVTIDLPGFGKSPLPQKQSFTIGDVAEEIIQWLAEKNITKSVVIGHSLGGYVALSMIEKNPDRFAGLGLFHSTAYADSPEKKQSRTKVLDFIDKNGVQAFTSNFIAPLFVNENNPAIERVKQIAVQSSSEAVKGYTLAMRDRPDRTSVLENFNKPLLFISGKKDGGIPVESIIRQSALAPLAEVHVLEDVAHMGMFENPTECTLIIRSFCQKCFQ